MTDKAQQPEHCEHECVCNKYINYTNTGATPSRVCNGETWCFKICPHDTRSRPHTPAPAVRMTCEQCGGIAPRFNGEKWLCPKCYDAAIARAATLDILKGVPNDLRMNGWMVAIHNDYRQNGEQHTFWLFTNKDGKYIKGEGFTDAEALEQIRESLRRQQQERE